MISYKDKATLLGRISVLLEIGYTLEETTRFIREDSETMNLMTIPTQQVWHRDPIIHSNDPYYSLHRMGLLNDFDLRALGKGDNNGERAKELSLYYRWEERRSHKESYDDEHFLLSYLYRYSLHAQQGHITPTEPTLGEPNLRKRFGIPIEEAFKDVNIISSDADYVDLIKSAGVFDPLCMAVIEHGILRATLGNDMRVLVDHLDRCNQSL